MHWFCERTSGVRTVGEGANGWEGLGLDHRDVTEPGRIKLLGFMDSRGRQTIVQLKPSETLHLTVRRTLTLGNVPQQPPILLLGIVREDGSGTYAIIQPDGNITLSTDGNLG